MNNLTNRISGIAMLALAALPIASLPASALAATVKVSDINVLTPQGMATFHDRADAAARDFCRLERGVGARAVCVTGVKAELIEKLSDLRVAKMDQTSKTFAAR